jgi:hypothetical protein
VLTFVDHHKIVGGFEARFIDIREDCGATSSIYAEYLEHSPFGLRPGVPRTPAWPPRSCTASAPTPTTSCWPWPIDYRAGAYLRQFLDNDLLRIISKQSITARTMEIIQRGLNNKVIRGTFLLAGVGFVREEDRDGIAQTADFLMRHEGVETAVVFGIVNGEVVDGSLRTASPPSTPMAGSRPSSAPTPPAATTAAAAATRAASASRSASSPAAATRRALGHRQKDGRRPRLREDRRRAAADDN